jgi:hypothetical protein
MKNKVNKVNKITSLTGTKATAVELWRETHGHISNLCRAVGISRKTYYDWMKEDPDFNQAIQDAESELNDEMRDALVNKAAGGELGAITYWLDRRHPEFKKSPIQVNTQINLYDHAIEEDRDKYR